MKKSAYIFFAIFLGGLVFIFGVWPLVEIVTSIFHSRPSNPWEYFTVRNRIQEHLDAAHPGYSITEMEYFSYRGYVITVSDGKNSFDIDHGGALYCHHEQCSQPSNHKTAAGSDEKLSREYLEAFEQALAQGLAETLDHSITLYLDHNLHEPLPASSYQEYGSHHANIQYSGDSEDLSPESCAKLLLRIRTAMDEAELPFAVCTLELHSEDDSFYLFEFPYTEIYEENLEKRLKEWN